MKLSERDMENIMKYARLAGEDDEEMIETIMAASVSNTGAFENISKYLRVTAAFDPKIFKLPDNTVNGSINFCTTENGLEAGIFLNEPHGLIAGQSGCGKSYLLLHMLIKASRSSTTWVFSRSEEGRRLLAFSNDILVNSFDGKIRFNPLLPPRNVRLSGWINVFCDVFIQAMTLYDGTKSFLIETLHELFSKNHTPTIKDLYFYIKSKKFSPFSRTARYQESALNRLAGILFSDLGTSFCTTISLESYLYHHLVFELQSLSAEQKVFVTNILLDYLFFYKLNNDAPCYHFIGVDDCHWLFDVQYERRPDKNVSIIHDLLSTIRKSKINIFAASQIPSLLGSSIHSNSYTKILMNLTNTRDILCMTQNMGMTDIDQIKYCQRLEKRQMVVRLAGRWQEPFLARVPELNFKEFNGEEVRRNNERVLGSIILLDARDIIVIQANSGKSEDEISETFKTDEKAFLMLVYNNPYLSITKYYRIGIEGRPISAGQGTRLVKRLVRKELVKIYEIPNLCGRGGHSKYMELTDKGYKAIRMPTRSRIGRGADFEHGLYQYKIAEHIKKMANVKRVSIEGFLWNKAVDVLAETNDEKKIGFEIAMTPEHELTNIQKDFEAGCDFVVIVCRDKRTMKKINAQLVTFSENEKRKIIVSSTSRIIKCKTIDGVLSLKNKN